MTDRAERRLLDLKARQEAGEHMMCPRCGRDAMKAPVHTNALSRTADVYVCDACGTAEAMLAFMKQDYPLHLWAAFQPVRPPADFKEHSARAVMDTVLRTQSDELRRLYQLCRDDPGNAEWYRLEAFESCPGLIELWPQPFQERPGRRHSDGGGRDGQIAQYDLRASGKTPGAFLVGVCPCRGHVAVTRRDCRPTRIAARPDSKARHAPACGVFRATRKTARRR